MGRFGTQYFSGMMFFIPVLVMPAFIFWIGSGIFGGTILEIFFSAEAYFLIVMFAALFLLIAQPCLSMHYNRGVSVHEALDLWKHIIVAAVVFLIIGSIFIVPLEVGRSLFAQSDFGMQIIENYKQSYFLLHDIIDVILLPVIHALLVLVIAHFLYPIIMRKRAVKGDDDDSGAVKKPKAMRRMTKSNRMFGKK